MTIDEAIREEARKKEDQKLTIDQAINLLNHLECHGAYYEAKQMAIHSLEAWEKVLIEINRIKCGADTTWYDFYRSTLDIICKHLKEVTDDVGDD